MKLLNGVLSTCAVALAFSTSTSLAAGTGEAGGQEAKQKSDMVSQLQKTSALNQLHHINQKEIQMAQLALDKAQSQQIKDAAQKILQDHRAVDQNLQSTAKNMNVKLESFQPSTHEKVVMERLKALDQKQFDQAFLSVMERSHQMAQQDLQTLSNQVTDNEVKQLVQSMLPRIQEHARSIASIQPAQQEAEIGGQQEEGMQQEQGAEQQQQPSESQQ